MSINNIDNNIDAIEDFATPESELPVEVKTTKSTDEIEEKFLEDAMHDAEPIPVFRESFYSTMNGDYKQTNDHLGVFYEIKINNALKKNDIPLKKQKNLNYFWNGRYWDSAPREKIKKFITDYIVKVGPVPHRSSNIVNNVFQNLENMNFQESYTPNQNIQYLNFENGVLKIRREFINNQYVQDFSFLDHNKAFNLDYCLDFEYDPKAKNTLWLEFLDQVLPNKNTQKTLQQVIGNLLIQGLKIEVLPFLYGTGGNGKSVVLEVIKGLFGEDNVTSYNLTSITTNEKVRASISDGKLMNLASENDMSNINVEVAKAYSSGEDLECRLNYGNPFTTNKYAKFLGNVNKLTLMDGDRTEALRRRQIIIPFRKKIRDEKNLKLDVNIHHKILQNKSGVLNWILTGMHEVFKNEKIYKSEEVIKLLNRYDEDTNPIKQMLKEKSFRLITVDSKKPKSEFITLKNIYKLYQEFLTEIGGGKLSRSNFKTDLLSIDGINEFSHNNVICFNITNSFQDQETKSNTQNLLFQDQN